MPSPYVGGCECGAVRYRITCEATVVYACHCTVCQKQSGSAFGMAMRVPVKHFHLTKGELKTFVRTAESGQTFTNSFCQDCGTRIHHSPDKSPAQVSLKPGTLDDTAALQPTHHVFVRSAQKWMQVPSDAEAFETVPDVRGWLSGKPA